MLLSVTGPNGSEEYSLKMEYVREVVHNMEEMPRVPKEDDRKQLVISFAVDNILNERY